MTKIAFEVLENSSSTESHPDSLDLEARSRRRRRLRARTTIPLVLAMGAAPFLFTPEARGQSKVTFGGSASTDAPPAAPASTPPAAAAAAEPSATDAEKEWAERDRQINEPNTLTGGVGLLRTQHAQSGAPGQFRLGFVTEWFSAGFLCTTDQACRDPRRAGQFITSDTMNHIGATISLGATLAKIGPGALEAYASTGGYANSDDANRPSLLQVLGDTNFGLKYGAALSPVFHIGGLAELWLINGTGAVGVDGSSTSAKFGPIFTADLRGTSGRIPLRFSLNTIYSLDNTANVLTSTESAPPTGRGQPVTRIERFGLNVNRVDHFDIRIGGEFFAAEDRVRPFVEYGIALPNNRQNYACKRNNPSADKCLADQATTPSALTIGGRFFPWKRGFSLLAALDIGISGTSNFIEEVQPQPPWTLFIGAGWAVDTQDRPPVVVTKTVEKKIEVVKDKVRGRILGTVHETGKAEAWIAGAIVSHKNHPELSSLATGADGKFSDEVVEAGDYEFDIKADGYKAGMCATKVPAGGGDVPLDCELEALPKVGSFIGIVRDADTNAPIGGVQVRLLDGAKKEAVLTTSDSGSVKFESLAPGAVEITATADNYLTLVTTSDVKVRQETKLDILMRPRPSAKNAAVEVGAKEIKIKQQIQFQLDSSVILPESFGLMNEIADVLIRNPRIRRIEIQGHTDNTGTRDHNATLSEQRADSVRLWLTQHGVPSDRLLAKGYGQDKPLVPNVTGANRQRNRRVQFIILDQDAAPKTP